MALGRPPGTSKSYDPMFCELLLDFFERASQAPTRELAAIETTIVAVSSDGSEITAESAKPATGRGSQKREVRRICGELPTIEGFSAAIGIPSSTVKEWANCGHYPDFS